MKNLFEKYDIASRDLCQISNRISSIVTNYIKETVGFVGEAGDKNNIGKTNPYEIGWIILDNDTIQISYSPYKDQWLDYWDDEKYIKVKYDELMKYEQVY